MFKKELKINDIKQVAIPQANFLDMSKFSINLNLFDTKPLQRKINPLAFQEDIIDKLYHYYMGGGERGTAILPCGVGKSYVSLFLIRKLNLNLAVIARFYSYIIRTI